MLASRVLHFCNGIVLFECNELQASSSLDFGHPYRAETSLVKDNFTEAPFIPVVFSLSLPDFGLITDIDDLLPAFLSRKGARGYVRYYRHDMPWYARTEPIDMSEFQVD